MNTLFGQEGRTVVGRCHKAYDKLHCLSAISGLASIYIASHCCCCWCCCTLAIANWLAIRLTGNCKMKRANKSITPGENKDVVLGTTNAFSADWPLTPICEPPLMRHPTHWIANHFIVQNNWIYFRVASIRTCRKDIRTMSTVCSKLASNRIAHLNKKYIDKKYL